MINKSEECSPHPSFTYLVLHDWHSTPKVSCIWLHSHTDASPCLAPSWHQGAPPYWSHIFALRNRQRRPTEGSTVHSPTIPRAEATEEIWVLEVAKIRWSEQNSQGAFLPTAAGPLETLFVLPSGVFPICRKERLCASPHPDPSHANAPTRTAGWQEPRIRPKVSPGTRSV